MFQNYITRIKNKHNREKRNVLRNEYLHFLRTLPIKKQSVMVEARDGDAIDGNAFYMVRELINNESYKDMEILISAKDSERATRFAQLLGESNRIQFVTVGTRDYYRAWATCEYLINDATISNFFIKREGQKYLNLWHGTPLKCMGRRVAHEPYAVGNAQKNFVDADYCLYPNEFMFEHMEEDYMLSDIATGKAVLSGYPRNSVFLDENRRSEVTTALGLDRYKIYTYMPTWRPSQMGDRMAEILKDFDKQLNDDEILLAKIHPLAASNVEYAQYKHVRKFPDEFETYETLNVSDALITDYSSVFFDYAVTGRNIVLYAYDAEEYLSTRGLYMSFDSLPFKQTKTVEATLAEVRAGKQYDDSDFCKKFCSYESLEAAEKLSKLFFNNDQSACKVADFKNNKLPNKLLYFGDLSTAKKQSEVLDELKKLNTKEANYFLAFHRSELEKDYTILNNLPEGIRYSGYAGKMMGDSEELKVIEAYKKGRITYSEMEEKISEAVNFEMLRQHGGIEIDEILFYGRPVIK